MQIGTTRTIPTTHCAKIIRFQLVKLAVNTLAVTESDINLILKYTGAIVLSGGCIALLRYWWRILLMGTAKLMEMGLREHLFSHILKLDARYYDRVKTGDLMARATSDINHVRLAFGIGMIALNLTVRMKQNQKLILENL